MVDTEIRSNPFPGLRSFEQDEEYLFFGREKQTDELLKKLRTTRFLSVIGASGSGKSSLVKSGLLPSLHAGYMTTAGSSWKVALFRPGDDPIGNLARVLSENGLLYEHDGDDTMYASIIEATLRRSRLGLFEAVRQSNITKEDNLLVIVDQFEELFRYSKYEEELHGEKVGSQAFINLLLNAINHEEANIYVGLTMRSDFLGDCTQFRNLPEAINEGQYLIPRMTRDDIKRAITGPIAVGGGEITPRLLTQLLNDVGDSPDQLPILQHALMRTWDYWENNHKEGEPLDIEHYEAIGTMTRALSLHAEEALSDLPNDHYKNLAEVLFKSLTDHGGKGQGIRRPTKLGEICELANAPIDEIKTVIESFRKTGRSLLMPPAGVPLLESTIIDISHESLMRVWTRLKKWDEEESAAAETYLRLANDAALYQEGKMGLLRGPELDFALKWKEEEQPNQKWAQRYNPSFERAMVFLEHSKKQNDFEIEQKEIEQKKRLVRARRTILLFAGASIFFLFMMLYAFNLKEEANAQRRKAENKEIEAKNEAERAMREEQNAKNAQKAALEAKDDADRSAKAARLARADAEFEAIQAEKARKIAVEAKKEADIQRDLAVSSRERAIKLEGEAKAAYLKADSLRRLEEKAKVSEIMAREDAEYQRLKADTLRNRAQSRNESFNAIQLINEEEFVEGAIKAISAHKLNVENKGPRLNSDNYKALSEALSGLQSKKQVFTGHKQSVRAIALNNYNDIVATGDEGGTVYVSKLQEGVLDEIQKFTAPGPIRALTFSSRGEYLMAATFEKHLAVWDANQLNSSKIEKISDKKYSNYIKAIACLNFSGEDYVLVSTGERVSIEKITSNGLIRVDTLNIPNAEVITVSADKNILLIGSNDYLYEYQLGESPVFSNPTIKKLESQIISISISGKNNIIAAGLLNGKIYIKDRERSNQLREYFSEHSSRVSSLNFFEFDGKIQLVSTGFDQTIKMMDVDYLLFENKDPAEDKITIDGHDKWIHGGLFSSDGKHFLTIGEDQKVKSWYATTADLADAVQKMLDKQ